VIHIEGRNGCAPTRRLSAALHTRHPHLTATAPGRPHLALAITPRATDPWLGLPMVRPDAWYDLHWTRKTTTEKRETLGHAGVLPAPPVLPLEAREAAVPPATLDGLSEQQITLLGGPQKALHMVTSRRAQAIRDDHTTSIYDWDTYADTTADLIASLTPPAGAR
jgi:hypothetical protein